MPGTYKIGAGTVSCSSGYLQHLQHRLEADLWCWHLLDRRRCLTQWQCDALSFGSGSTANSFTIGSGSAGYAINTAGGSTTTFGNMASGTFQAVGKISTGGGSSISLSAAPAHDLNGAFSLAGSATLGAGTYTVAGNFALGTGGGGGSVTGNNVSIITSGSFSVAAEYKQRHPDRAHHRDVAERGSSPAMRPAAPAFPKVPAAILDFRRVLLSERADHPERGWKRRKWHGPVLGTDRPERQPERRVGPRLHMRLVWPAAPIGRHDVGSCAVTRRAAMGSAGSFGIATLDSGG